MTSSARSLHLWAFISRLQTSESTHGLSRLGTGLPLISSFFFFDLGFGNGNLITKGHTFLVLLFSIFFLFFTFNKNNKDIYIYRIFILWSHNVNGGKMVLGIRIQGLYVINQNIEVNIFSSIIVRNVKRAATNKPKKKKRVSAQFFELI